MSREYVLRPFRKPVELQIDYAKELNEQQHAAVTAPPGPSLVIAGAGSGKTRALTYRVAFLIEQGIPPERILLLTFTNKAAREMMRRVADLIGRELPELWGGTFHSIGHRILRQQAQVLGIPRDFTIMDRDDAEHLIAACLGESNIDPKATRFPKRELIASIFSLAVNTCKSIRHVVGEQYSQFVHLAPQIEQLASAYAGRKLSTGCLDFDDLLMLWLKLLRDHADVRELYQRRFQFLLVDEYQDTNKLQSDIIDLLAERHKNVMVVGDDAQSIYAWRGANFMNIFEFPKRYPGAKVYKIETNYRSTPEILNFANAAIRANEQQFAKELTPARKPGPKPTIVACDNANVQARFVAQRVLELREEGSSLSDMAVLYRSHFHALELQMELTSYNIPFTITSGIRFFEQAHLKDVIAWLKLLTNPRDELSFKRIVLLMPGVGPKAADKLWKACAPALAAIEAGSTEANATPIARALQTATPATPKKATAAWAQFLATAAQLEGEAIRGKTADMIRLILEAVYEEHLKQTYPNYRTRLEELQQLAVFSRQFNEIGDFLAQLALLSNVEAEGEQPADKDDERLKLTTVHQAKGLEFEVVFVIMLCEGLFPSSRASETPEGVEEERRLMYVAVTRAKNELYLCYPVMRANYGGSGESAQIMSRFLREVPEDLREELILRLY